MGGGGEGLLEISEMGGYPKLGGGGGGGGGRGFSKFQKGWVTQNLGSGGGGWRGVVFQMGESVNTYINYGQNFHLSFCRNEGIFLWKMFAKYQ